MLTLAMMLFAATVQPDLDSLPGADADLLLAAKVRVILAEMGWPPEPVIVRKPPPQWLSVIAANWMGAGPQGDWNGDGKITWLDFETYRPPLTPLELLTERLRLAEVAIVEMKAKTAQPRKVNWWLDTDPNALVPGVGIDWWAVPCTIRYRYGMEERSTAQTLFLPPGFVELKPRSARLTVEILP